MLVISNGAYKSGSTWLFFILKQLTGYDSPPLEFLNPMWKNPSIDPEKLENFLERGLYKTNNYLVKQHFSGNLLEKFRPYMNGNILFFNIKRDVRDVIVSSYYHVKRERKDFFRKGQVGDYKNHYTRLMYRDYAEKESIVKLKIVGSIFMLPELIFKVARRFWSTE